MRTSPDPQLVLPALRPDVEMTAGPADADGSPTWIIHDPQRNTFEKANWAQGQVLGRLREPGVTLEQLTDALERETALRLSATDIVDLCADAQRRGLTADSTTRPVQEIESLARLQRTAPLRWLLHHYLYLRVPLLRPDAMLDRTLPLARPLASRAAFVVYALLATAGLYFLLQRFDEYISTFPRFLNGGGLLAYGLAIIVLKAIHEFAHAYVAKALGNRVRSMGIAFIVLFPVAYSDVTDSWRMTDRRKRSLIAAAGMIAELVIAGIALLVWGLAPPGLLQSICFVVSSVTMLTTFLVNLNPLMRFDGYYLLCDWWGIDNLQPRSSAVLRWTIRRQLLGMPLPCPEPRATRRRLAAMAVFAACVWVYRFFLYLGIALLVYHQFTKVVGLFLFAVEIVFFIVRPVINEIAAIIRLRSQLRPNWRLLATGATGLALLAWLALPLPRWTSAPAVTFAANSQTVYAPHAGVIRVMHAKLDGRVSAGQLLCTLDSTPLNHRLRLAKLELERLELELAQTHTQPDRRSHLAATNEALSQARAKLAALRQTVGRSSMVADLDGRIVQWDPTIAPGVHVAEGTPLGHIVPDEGPRVACYVDPQTWHAIEVGQRVSFYSDAGARAVEGIVRFRSPAKATHLEHPALAAAHGGPIAIAPDAGHAQVPLDSLYRIEIELTDPPRALRIGQTGSVTLRTPARSRLIDLLRHAAGILLRESSF